MATPQRRRKLSPQAFRLLMLSASFLGVHARLHAQVIGPDTAPPPAQTQAAPPIAAPAVTPAKKSGSWDWLWPSIVALIIVKLFGLVGGLVTLGCYYWLKPKLGTWGAVAASGVIGAVAAIGLLAIIRS